MNEDRRFHWQDVVLPIFAAFSVLALLFRLPNAAMDLLLSANLAISATIFLSTFFIRKPLEFSAFPTILLTTTLYRLVLNVSTTRLILTQGDAGQVIDAFSRFVAGDSVVVGAVVFLIFIIIQFVVITKGATRISEVTARFTLDALPGRQSAIDFDLNAGNITESEAQAARAELNEQSDFFGAMDGASKFVRGDAIAGLAIVVVNLLGGLCIGVFQRHMSVVEAVGLYGKLTIGDGLVAQVPAFLISIATGLLVARTSRVQNISSVALTQTFGKPIVLLATGFFLLFLAFTGLPFLPLATLSSGFFLLAWRASKGTSGTLATEAPTDDSRVRKQVEAEEDEELERALRVETFEIAVGSGLSEVAIPREGPTLLDRVKRTRRALASELGVVLPKTRVRDDQSLDENQYSIRLNGVEVELGVVYPQMLLAVDTGYAVAPLEGLVTTSPEGSRAFWIASDASPGAEDSGYELMTPGDIIEQHTLLTARREASSFLTRDATRSLVERRRESSPSLVEESLGGSRVDAEVESRRLARIQRVLRDLLAEEVSIRPLDAILETLNDLSLSEPSAGPWRELEAVRERLSRSLVGRFRDIDGVLRAALFDPAGEDALRDALSREDSRGPIFTLTPSQASSLVESLKSACGSLVEAGLAPVVLIDRELRYALHAFASSSGIRLYALSFDELDSRTSVSQEAVVDWKGA